MRLSRHQTLAVVLALLTALALALAWSVGREPGSPAWPTRTAVLPESTQTPYVVTREVIVPLPQTVQVVVTATRRPPPPTWDSITPAAPTPTGTPGNAVGRVEIGASE